MNDEEGTVATQETETAEALPVATPDAPPVTTPEGAAGPEKEAAPEAEQLPATEEAPPSYATIDGKPYGDDYEVLEALQDREAFQRRDRELGERAVAQGREEATRDFKREEAATVIDGVVGAIGNALERMGEGNIEGAERLVARIEQMVKPYGTTFVSDLAGQAHREGGQNTGALVLDGMKAGLPLKAQHELADFAKSGHKDWRPILQKYVDFLRPGIEAEIEQMRTSREGKEAKAEEKGKGKPPVKPEGGGGGGGTAEKDKAILRSPTATGPEKREAYKRIHGYYPE